jgi:2,5-diketo-D-gluconate reductase A
MTETIPTLKLPGGVQMPMIALGTWPMDNAQTAAAVETALAAGYRHIDTAENYRNESGVGEGLRRAGLPRDQVFITTKFNKEWHSAGGVRQAFEAACDRLGVDYLDLFLIHWPNPGQDTYVDAFKGLKALLDEGRVRAIGTSNFKPAHLQRLLDVGLTPAVNQIELNPEHVRTAEQSFHRKNGIVTSAYSPLGRGGAFLQDPAIETVADAHGKTASQVVLRWHIQQGIAAAPKSSDPQRQRENLGIFDFELSPSEIARIDALDTGAPVRLDSDEFGH